MKLVTKEIEKWKRWTKGLSELVEETTLNISKEGVSALCDTSGALAIVRLGFDKDSFEEYNINKERAIAVDIDKMSKILKKGDKSSKMTFTLDDSNSRLKITFKNNGVRTFTIPLLSRTQQSTDIPSNMNHVASFTVTVGKFLDEIDNVSLMSQNFGIKATEDSISFTSTETGQGNYESEISKDEISNLNVDKECSSTFQISLIDDIVSSLKNSWKIKINMGQGQPIEIISGDDNSNMDAFVAPIIR